MKVKQLLPILFVCLLAACKTVESNNTDTSKPEYPAEDVSGYVLFKFDIEVDGSPSNIEVLEEQPKGVFTENALKAIKKWKFKPKLVDGKPARQIGMTYKLQFVLED